MFLSKTLSHLSSELAANFFQKIAESASLSDLFAYLTISDLKAESLDWAGLISAVSRFDAPLVGVEDGVAKPSDIHLCLSIAEIYSDLMKPDVIVGLNSGGKIVCDYIVERGKKTESSHFKRRIRKDNFNNIRLSRYVSDKDSVSDEKCPPGGNQKTLLIVDDVVRTGATMIMARRMLREEFPLHKIRVVTLLCSDRVVRSQRGVEDFSACTAQLRNVRLPYDSHGDFKARGSVNVFGSIGNDLSITDYEAELFKKEALKSLLIRAKIWSHPIKS